MRLTVATVATLVWAAAWATPYTDTWAANGENARPGGDEGFQACLAMFPGATAPGSRSPTTIDLCKVIDGAPIFAVRFDTRRKIPSWTAHRLSPAQMAQITANAGTAKRPKFRPDPDLPRDDQALDKSYTRSGYSRGHMVPANDMSWSKASYDATFYLSNVVPQKQPFNAGTWLGAEDAFRRYVATKDIALWNISGVYGTLASEPTIGVPPHTPTVPTCYYKIIAAPQGDNRPYKVLALLYHWDDFGKRETWGNAVTTLDTINQRTGIDFLQGLAVEATFDAAYWGVEMPATPADCQ